MRPLLSVCLLFTSACMVAKVTRNKDALAPQNDEGTVSLVPLATAVSNSRSVFTQPREKDLMSRVLLSPNVVFESSRSSAAEPRTVGPAGGEEGTPNLPDALGRPVNISLSTRLIEYLSTRGSLLMTPAVTRRLGEGWWCSDPARCPQATWVERLMMLYGARRWGAPPDGDRGGEKREAPPALGDVRPQDLATAALAVRELDFSAREMEAVVEQVSPGQYEVRFRRGNLDNGGLCGDLKVQVPMVYFQAELVSMRDGRLLARIFESRSPRAQVNLRRTITLTRHSPVYQAAYEEKDWQGVFVETSKYEYIARWNQDNLLCENVRGMIRTWQGAVYEALRTELGSTSVELFKTAFDPLYSQGRDTVTSTAPITMPPEPPPPPTVAAPLPPPLPPGTDLAPPPGACQSNEDCKAGRVCLSGQCVVAPTTPCVKNGDCGRGRVCQSGKCVQ